MGEDQLEPADVPLYVVSEELLLAENRPFEAVVEVKLEDVPDFPRVHFEIRVAGVDIASQFFDELRLSFELKQGGLDFLDEAKGLFPFVGEREEIDIELFADADEMVLHEVEKRVQVDGQQLRVFLPHLFKALSLYDFIENCVL